MTRQILETKWKDVPFEEVEKFAHRIRVGDRNFWETEQRGKPVKIYIPPMQAQSNDGNHPCVCYEIVGKNATACPHLVEIGD